MVDTVCNELEVTSLLRSELQKRFKLHANDDKAVCRLCNRTPILKQRSKVPNQTI